MRRNRRKENTGEVERWLRVNNVIPTRHPQGSFGVQLRRSASCRLAEAPGRRGRSVRRDVSWLAFLPLLHVEFNGHVEYGVWSRK